MNRRHFCCGIGSLAMTAWGSAGATFATAVDERFFERTAQAFGTSIKISVRHASRHEAESALTAAFHEVRLIESLMSIYRPDSQISRLNQHGVLRGAHPYVIQLLRIAERMSRETFGAFDITVQSLWQLHKDCSDRGEVPRQTQIASVRRRVGMGRIELGKDTVRLKPGTQITLNGIAQGFATDCVKRALWQGGIRSALIDIGEVAAVGEKQKRQPWRVGIQHPRQDNAFVNVTSIQDRCLATSGDYATRFTNDFRSHHILDPHTGRSPEELASVSVLAPSATAADALSTSIFVTGVERGLQLLNSRQQVDLLLVDKDGHVRSTAGFPLETDL